MQYTATVKIDEKKLRELAFGMAKPHDRKKLPRTPKVYKVKNQNPGFEVGLPFKNLSKLRVEFYKASLRHELSPRVQKQLISFARQQLTIRLPIPFYLSPDWWGAHRGPRFKLKLPLRVRLLLAAAVVVFYMRKPRVS